MDGNTDQKGKNLIPHASNGGDSRPVKNFSTWIEEKGLVIVLAVLCAVAVVLAGFVIANLGAERHDTEVAVDESSDEDDNDWSDDEGVIGVDEDDEAIDEGEIARYDELIGSASSDEEKAALYGQKADYIMTNDAGGVLKEQAIESALAADRILRSIDSAALVSNVASAYSDQSLVDEYTAVFKQRSAEAGIDINGGGRG